MDSILLTFFNKSLANPINDVLMASLSMSAYIALPGMGLYLYWRSNRQLGMTVLFAVFAVVILTLLVQLFAQRPRPEDIRLLFSQPQFPAYPSGHAAAAFAAAAVTSLSLPGLRLTFWVFSSAVLISLSRMYLGFHYFSDLFGGAVLGAAVGAAFFGFMMTQSTGARKWRWLLWPQVAVVIILTQMTYLNLPPNHTFTFEHTDKIMHFLLFGAVAFWLNIWLEGRRKLLFRRNIPIAILLPFTIAIVEETLQFFSPYRTLSAADLLSDLTGMLFFWWLSEKLLTRWKKAAFADKAAKELESVSG